MEMMEVIGTATFQIRRIHVVDKNELGHLESTFYDFEDDKAINAKWRSLLKEMHYSIDMISETISTASAFHK